jgi:hypothetical protein
MAATMTNLSIISRIVWCRRLRRQASTQPEVDGWRAEEQGLRDALLTRDHSNHYRSCLPSTFKRYLLGFEDAQAMIRMAPMERHVAQASDSTHVSSPWLFRERVKRDAHINLLVEDERPNRHGLELHRERSAALIITDFAMQR